MDAVKQKFMCFEDCVGFKSKKFEWDLRLICYRISLSLWNIIFGEAEAQFLGMPHARCW